MARKAGSHQKPESGAQQGAYLLLFCTNECYRFQKYFVASIEFWVRTRYDARNHKPRKVFNLIGQWLNTEIPKT